MASWLAEAQLSQKQGVLFGFVSFLFILKPNEPVRCDCALHSWGTRITIIGNLTSSHTKAPPPQSPTSFTFDEYRTKRIVNGVVA
jgi:hypothetical protein